MAKNLQKITKRKLKMPKKSRNKLRKQRKQKKLKKGTKF